MTKTDELMALMIQEGERLVEEVEYLKTVDEAMRRQYSEMQAEFGQSENYLIKETDRTASLRQQLKQLVDDHNRDIRITRGVAALMGFIAGVLLMFIGLA